MYLHKEIPTVLVPMFFGSAAKIVFLKWNF